MTKHSENVDDDLTLIKGIGDARQRLLNVELNVNTFVDLAAVDPSLLQSEFKKRNEAVSLEMVLDWVAHASLIVAAIHHSKEALVVEQLDVWQAYATFVVEFQTIQNSDGRCLRTNVHHMQVDDTCSWEGVAHQPLGDWIADRVTGDKHTGGECRVNDASTDEPDVFAAMIEDFQLFAGELVVYGNQRPVIALDSQENLLIEVRIKLMPLPIKGQQIILSIKCLAKHVETNRVHNLLLNDAVMIPFGSPDERIRIAAKALPVGSYHVLIAVGSEFSCVRPHFSEIEEVCFVERYSLK